MQNQLTLIELVNAHSKQCRVMSLENQHFAKAEARARELWTEIKVRFPEYVASQNRKADHRRAREEAIREGRDPRDVTLPETEDREAA